MTISLVSSHQNQSATATGSISVSITTPNSGDIIVAIGCTQRADRAINAIQDQNTDAFTLLNNYTGSNGQPGAYAGFKISDGDETTITAFNNSTAKQGISVLVFRSTVGWASSPPEAKNEDETNVAGSGTSQATGSATATTANGVAVALFGCANGADWDNSFGEDGTDFTEVTSPQDIGSGIGGTGSAYLIYSSTGAKSATFSTAGGGSNSHGQIALFAEAAAGLSPPPSRRRQNYMQLIHH